MIVKKMPILQGFPDFECVRKLSISTGQTSDFNPVFYVSKPPDYHEIPLFYI